jgi:hypothetical protein
MTPVVLKAAAVPLEPVAAAVVRLAAELVTAFGGAAGQPVELAAAIRSERAARGALAGLVAVEVLGKVLQSSLQAPAVSSLPRVLAAATIWVAEFWAEAAVKQSVA